MTRDDIIRMAREAGFMDSSHPFNPWSAHTDQIERFAALVAAAEAKRADALAATIAALRDIVTNDAESKADFIARVRNVLGSCPDERVLHAVEAEREACARVAERSESALHCAATIRARGETK